MYNIAVNTPLLDGNEKKYLCECIDTGWISSEGPFVKKFEESFAEKVGRKYAISVCNGSVALDLAVISLGIGEGDEVIIPTFTIISCAAAVLRSGAIPVLVDADPYNWNMDVNQIESKITKKTKAIMVVHIYGLPVNMCLVQQLANKYNLKIIEDAAEMHGQTYDGKPCGSFGEISVFSFYPNKHITTGEGGMVVTDNIQIFNKLQSLRNLCFLPQKRFVHEELGWNYRFTNIQAALGLAQLERLDEFVIRKREIGKLYHELLCDIESIQLPISSTSYADNIYWVFGIILKKSANKNAKDVMNLLNEQGIGTRPFFYPMHLQPVFNKRGLFNNEKHINSEYMSDFGFYLPSGLGLKNNEIKIVAETLRKILE
jgi:perosamine synthetase